MVLTGLAPAVRDHATTLVRTENRRGTRRGRQRLSSRWSRSPYSPSPCSAPSVTDMASSSTAASRQPVARRSPLRAVAMPTEHGGWGLTAEPVLLGLIVAPSIAGGAIGAAAIVA